MRNIPFEHNSAFMQLPERVRQQRLHRVILEELTRKQREVLIAYYFQGESIPQIAARRGVHKSTVSRTLHRAEERLRRFLRY